MKRKIILLICGIVALCISACSVTKNNSGDSTSAVNTEEETEGKTIKIDGLSFDGNTIKFINEETKFLDDAIGMNYTILIKNIEMSSEIKGDETCWQKEIGMEDAEEKEGQLINGKIIYIDFVVTNNLDNNYDFYTSTIGLMGVYDGEVRPLSESPNYCNLMGAGKDAFKVTLQPGEEKNIQVGYYVCSEDIESTDIYVDPSSGTLYDSYKTFYSIPGVSSVQKE